MRPRQVRAWGEGLGAAIESLLSDAPELEQRIVGRDEARRRLAQLKPDRRTALGYFAAGRSYWEIVERCGRS